MTASGSWGVGGDMTRDAGAQLHLSVLGDFCLMVLFLPQSRTSAYGVMPPAVRAGLPAMPFIPHPAQPRNSRAWRLVSMVILNPVNQRYSL